MARGKSKRRLGNIPAQIRGKRSGLLSAVEARMAAAAETERWDDETSPVLDDNLSEPNPNVTVVQSMSEWAAAADEAAAAAAHGHEKEREQGRTDSDEPPFEDLGAALAQIKDEERAGRAAGRRRRIALVAARLASKRAGFALGTRALAANTYRKHKFATVTAAFAATGLTLGLAAGPAMIAGSAYAGVSIARRARSQRRLTAARTIDPNDPIFDCETTEDLQRRYRTKLDRLTTEHRFAMSRKIHGMDGAIIRRELARQRYLERRLEWMMNRANPRSWLSESVGAQSFGMRQQRRVAVLHEELQRSRTLTAQVDQLAAAQANHELETILGGLLERVERQTTQTTPAAAPPGSPAAAPEAARIETPQAAGSVPSDEAEAQMEELLIAAGIFPPHSRT